MVQMETVNVTLIFFFKDFIKTEMVIGLATIRKRTTSMLGKNHPYVLRIEFIKILVNAVQNIISEKRILLGKIGIIQKIVMSLSRI